MPLLLLGLVVLVGGVLAGFARLGVIVPMMAVQAAGSHGALLAAIFFGVVIGLERAVALGSAFWYLAPLGSGAAGVLVLTGYSDAGAILSTAGATIFFAASVRALQKLPALFTVTLAAGALAAALGSFLWWHSGVAATAVPLWLAFLLLTIAGERLELTRLLPPRPAARKFFVGLLLALVIAVCWALAGETRPLSGVMLALAAWLLYYDIARHNAARNGLPRFVAISLLSGYVMLALGASIGLTGAFAPGHPWRDAALHSIFLGFVFAMVIGHAPLVFPAVMRVRIPYHPVFYLPLLLLQGSVVLRVAGSLRADGTLLRAGAEGSAAALAVLIVVLLARVAAGSRKVAL
ncbi:MAG: hypothetical protein JSR19_09620 [Proteobacteria bacterium]|nr:hypothetical protein [Pseudomonadota bacterium]